MRYLLIAIVVAVLLSTSAYAAPAGCTDSDGGANSWIKGQTGDAMGSVWDSCAGDFLTEWYCSGGSKTSMVIDCFMSGYVCNDGKCETQCNNGIDDDGDTLIDEDDGGCYDLSWTYKPNDNIESDEKCTSTDYPPLDGINLITFGFAEDDGGKCGDACNAADSDTIWECYCTTPVTKGVTTRSCDNDLGYSGMGMDCPTNYCVPKCEEDDIAAVPDRYSEKGTTAEGNNGKTDYCMTAIKLKEYYCDGSFVRQAVEYDCPYGCSDGRCNACGDSDKGIAPQTLGTTQNGSEMWDDSCWPNLEDLKEYYCSGDDVISTTLSCDEELGIGDMGAVCAAGVCGEACEENDTDIVPDRYDEKGSTVKGITMNTDVCSSMTELTEYYCDVSDNIASTPYTCPAGLCLDAECTTETCYDDDGGRVEVNKGTTVDILGSSDSDACVNESILTEWYCDSGTKGSMEIRCALYPLFQCITGRCIYVEPPGCPIPGTCLITVPQCYNGLDDDGNGLIDYLDDPGCDAWNDDDESTPLCSDTDGGSVVTVLGTADNGTANGTDYCADTANVFEYYCNLDDIKKDQKSCINEIGNTTYNVGAECSDGVCVEACQDTDGGKEYGVKGETGKGMVGEQDSCSGPKLKEWFCNASGEPEYEKVACPTCVAGACELTTCNVNKVLNPGFVLWSDGFDEIVNSPTEVPMYMVLLADEGEDCTGVTAEFTVYDSSKAEQSAASGDTMTVDFEQEPVTGQWFAVGTWTPLVEESYTFDAVLKAGIAGKETEESDVVTVADCAEPLGGSPDDCPDWWEDSGHDPDEDMDCDGVRDCVDSWMFYGADSDSDGIPDWVESCITSCDAIPWSECERDAETGKYEKYRTLVMCGSAPAPCCDVDLECFNEYSPTLYGSAVQTKSCEHEEIESFAVFDWINALVVMIMIVTYYAIVKKEHIHRKRKKRR